MLSAENHFPVRRIVTLDAIGGTVHAQIADNVHHFSLILTHRAGIVTAIAPIAHRVPWGVCPRALARIGALVGNPIAGASAADIDKTQQCTHVYDLARLAMAHAARGGRRRYDIDVRLGERDQTVDLTAMRDGSEILHWIARDETVISEGAFRDHALRGPSKWPAIATDPDIREAALLLRRANLVFVESGPNRLIDRAVQQPEMVGACFTFQSERIAQAGRLPGFRFYDWTEVESMLNPRPPGEQAQ